jgi:hypothetical protein
MSEAPDETSPEDAEVLSHATELPEDWANAEREHDKEREAGARLASDEEKIEEWEAESFPASDPPSNY